MTKPMPPGYIEQIQQLVKLIVRWCGEQPGLPDLRWHDPGEMVYVGPLKGEPLKFLANSPDAFRLLEWLDAQTGCKVTILQATIALAELGHLPQPAAAEHVRGIDQQVKSTSAAMRKLEAFAFNTGTDTRVPVSPCPHCGKGLDGATGAREPHPGDLGMCVSCYGFLQYGEGLVLQAITEEQIAALDADAASQICEMRDVMRSSTMKPSGQRKGEA
jgi:hypothetical protein